MNTIDHWVLAARPKTLVAAVVPVLIGCALATQIDSFKIVPASICLVFALLIQIGTNFANDYYDYIKGADTEERIGPKRAVAGGLIAPEMMRLGMIVAFACALLIGATLISYGGWVLVIIGILSVVCGIAYTGGPYPLGYNGLGDVFVCLFFGLIAVMATFYVQTRTITLVSFLAALPAGALTTNLLVVNNYRDVKTDRKAGKRTLAVRFGRKFAYFEHQAMNVLAMMIPIFLLIFGQCQIWILLPLCVWPYSQFIAWKLTRASTSRDYQYALEGTARHLLLFGLLFAIGLGFS